MNENRPYDEDDDNENEENIDDEITPEDETDDDDDETSSDESDQEMVEKEKLNDDEFKQKLDELEKQIAENKFQYQYYLDIIQLTREQGNLEKLREYREKMCQIFPLSENLWLDWVKDEQKLIETESDRHKVNNLFLKAVEDYLSVDIWLEYIQFSIGGMGEQNGIENIRAICEKAISFAGYHVTKGYSLWEAYREFETALLAGYQQSFAASVQTTEQNKKIEDQLERIHRLFKAQLRVCLDNLEQTIKELMQFDESKIDKEIKETFETTLARYKKIEQFELDLKSSKDDPVRKLNDYKNYLEFELKLLKDLENSKYNFSGKNGGHKNKMNDVSDDVQDEQNELKSQRLRLKCLFERALADNSNCLDESLWLKYIFFLNEEEQYDPNDLNNKEFHLKVAKRSTRNCPWSSKLWINYALMLEKLNSTTEEIKSVYNEAMNAGLQTSDDYLQMWNCYIDYLRRSLIENSENLDEALKLKRDAQVEELRDTFQKAINQLYEYFKNNGDPGFSLEKYWALVEAKYFKNMEKSRRIYNEMILNKGNVGKFAVEWLEFYDLEKVYGDEKHQRKLLSRALNEVKDNAEKEIIYELFYKFEKLNGNVQQFNSFYWKYEQFKRARQIELANIEASKKSDRKAQIKPAKKSENKTVNKDTAQEETSKSLKSNILKRKKSENDSESTSKKKAVEKVDNEGFLIPALPSVNDQQIVKKKDEKIPTSSLSIKTTTASDTKKPINGNSNLTVFISNLSYDADESKIRAIFEKEPGFKDIRILKHWSGKSKGYGYVDFETPEQAANVLKLDRTPIDGRPLFVSPNEDKSLDFGQSKFKYPVNLEKKKLFISGLPFSTDKAALEEIFNNFGNLKEVRIVTYKNGKSKGLAYVEFEDEQSASKALIQTDGMLIGEHQISVAISNPPKRNERMDFTQSNEAKSTQITGLGSGSLNSRTTTSNISTSSSTKSSNSMSFLPRSQVVNTNRKKTLNF